MEQLLSAEVRFANSENVCFSLDLLAWSSRDIKTMFLEFWLPHCFTLYCSSTLSNAHINKL